jgi:hypothetical protein
MRLGMHVFEVKLQLQQLACILRIATVPGARPIAIALRCTPLPDAFRHRATQQATYETPESP